MTKSDVVKVKLHAGNQLILQNTITGHEPLNTDWQEHLCITNFTSDVVNVGENPY